MSGPASLVSIFHDYFDRALSEVKGMKCLILDPDTTRKANT